MPRPCLKRLCRSLSCSLRLRASAAHKGANGSAKRLRWSSKCFTFTAPLEWWAGRAHDTFTLPSTSMWQDPTRRASRSTSRKYSRRSSLSPSPPSSSPLPPPPSSSSVPPRGGSSTSSTHMRCPDPMVPIVIVVGAAGPDPPPAPSCCPKLTAEASACAASALLAALEMRWNSPTITSVALQILPNTSLTFRALNLANTTSAVRPLGSGSCGKESSTSLEWKRFPWQGASLTTTHTRVVPCHRIRLLEAAASKPPSKSSGTSPSLPPHCSSP
mmetsp:Transcript_29370/g.53166  ORF Transcript_29370/g.53166 Transcript_29370/m.53166 type:complete len:272 (-) Transcript_29370:6-821(-)